MGQGRALGTGECSEGGPRSISAGGADQETQLVWIGWGLGLALEDELDTSLAANNSEPPLGAEKLILWLGELGDFLHLSNSWLLMFPKVNTNKQWLQPWFLRWHEQISQLSTVCFLLFALAVCRRKSPQSRVGGTCSFALPISTCVSTWRGVMLKEDLPFSGKQCFSVPCQNEFLEFTRNPAASTREVGQVCAATLLSWVLSLL